MNPRKLDNPLFEPGNCLTCGQPSPSGRNSAGQCNNCHNAAYYARKAKEKINLLARKEEGAAYWRLRGIALGETVVCCGMGVFGPFRAEGVAKSGSVGAYVKSKWQRGFLRPEAFAKMERSAT